MKPFLKGTLILGLMTGAIWCLLPEQLSIQIDNLDTGPLVVFCVIPRRRD
jgi:hypothetical protein